MAPSRFWCGPYDPDPVIAQIGAVRLGLTDDFPILDTFRRYVTPVDRFGAPYELDPLFTKLTGISKDTLASDGMALDAALSELDTFSRGARLWSWGKDEFNMVAISCYVAGILPVIPATRFGNACTLVLKAGMPYDDIKKTRSDGLAGYFGVHSDTLRSHDAVDDATSVALALQHLLRGKTLRPADFS